MPVESVLVGQDMDLYREGRWHLAWPLTESVLVWASVIRSSAL